MQTMTSSPDHAIVVGRRYGADSIGEDLFNSMGAMRCRVFKERLDWEVPIQSGLEHDEYDDGDAVYILIVRRRDHQVEGGLRIRPSTRPNMLRNTFPSIMAGEPIPEDEHTCEISRLALMNPKRLQKGAAAFADMTNELLGHLMLWGQRNSCKRYMWVTSTPIERLMRKSLLDMQRISPVVRIGDVMCVADAMPVTERSAEHCFKLMSVREAIAA